MDPRRILSVLVFLLFCHTLSAQDWEDPKNRVLFPELTQPFTGCDSLVEYQKNYYLGGKVTRLNQSGYPSRIITYDYLNRMNDSMVVSYTNGLYTRADRYVEPGWVFEEIVPAYNGQNQIIRETTRLDYRNEGMENSVRFTYSYNSNGLMLTRIYEDWKTTEFEEWHDTAWVVISLDSFFYVNGKITKELSYAYNHTTKKWTNYGRGIFTYHTNGNLSNVLWESYDPAIQSWYGRQREKYTYSSSNDLLAVKIDHWDVSIWRDNDIDSMKVINGIPHVITYRRIRGYWDEYNRRFCGGSIHTPLIKPNTPGTLTASADTLQPSIRLTWADNAANEAGYYIYRSTDGNNFSLIDSVSANAVTYHNQNLSYDTRYWYKVAAFNSAGESAFSNTADATTMKALGIRKEAAPVYSIYPVPADDHIFIAGQEEVNAVVITDMTGRTAMVWNAGNTGDLRGRPMPVGSLPAGLYYLRLLSKGAVTGKVVVIEH